MNRDTLYSMAVVDTSQGATINRLDVTEGWNFLMRICPGRSVLEGACTLPAARPVR